MCSTQHLNWSSVSFSMQFSQLGVWYKREEQEGDEKAFLLMVSCVQSAITFSFLLLVLCLVFTLKFFKICIGIIDLQCCISFKFTAKLISYTCTYSHSFPVQAITEHECAMQQVLISHALYIVACMCQSTLPIYIPLVCVCIKSLQSCLTLCNPMDCSPPNSCPRDSPGQKYLPNPGI